MAARTGSCVFRKPNCNFVSAPPRFGPARHSPEFVVRSEDCRRSIEINGLRAPTLNKGPLNRNGHFERCTHLSGGVAMTGESVTAATDAPDDDRPHDYDKTEFTREL